MKILSKENDAILKLLSKFCKSEPGGRLLHYCVEQPVPGGHLLFNLLTRELIFLNKEDWKNRFENEALKRRWFFVPEDCKDKEFANLVNWVLENKQKQSQNITDYTIFTTTDCNARCFYCFELGRSRVPMSEETAEKVACYIADHYGGEKVSLRWFGGEPLFNREVIEIICDGLRQRGVEFTSSMVSNGYLFDEATVAKAASWNLKWVQITLDGTEAVYNKVKAFIYKEGSPYRVVLENIGHLLDAGVAVSVRLNMDMHNAANLLELVEELGQRFQGRKGLTVYAQHIFEGSKAMADSHTEEEWAVREKAMIRLEEKIREVDLASRAGIPKKLRTNFCMADSGNSVTILPSGEIGLCEHYSESEFIGHIDREGFDQAVVDSWKERIPEIPECATCFYYPQCRQLKKCPNRSVCFDLIRREQRRKVERQMLNEYEKWKRQEIFQEEPEGIDC